MRLKELNCKNCGATLEVEENATQVKCKFCNTTFAVEDAYTDGYKFEKGKLQAQSEHFEKSMEQVNDFLNNNPIAKIHKKMSIIITIIFVVIFVMVLIGIISTSVSQNKMRDKINDDSIINDMNDYMSDFDIKVFNNQFEMYKGTEYGSSVGRLLDEVSTNNKKNADNQVTVVFKETTTKDPEEMKNIKKQLGDWTEYEVSFEYNDSGLIYLATIEE